MNNKKAAFPSLPKNRAHQTPFQAVLTTVAITLLSVAQTPQAEIRTDVTTALTPTTASATTSSIGGLRQDSTLRFGVTSSTQSGVNTTPAVTTSPSPYSAPLLTPLSPSPRIEKDALGNDIIRSAQKSSTTPLPSDQVFVFVHVSEFSPIISERLDDLYKVPNIKPTLYMDERKPQDYMKMLGSSFLSLSDKYVFHVDSSGELAEAYGVTETPEIIYRLPDGAVRKYSLINGLDSFLQEWNRIHPGKDM